MPLKAVRALADRLRFRIGSIPRLLAACIACWATDAAAEQFPYTAFVSAPDVYIRSGPGENYYPVSKLERGEQVEVYRHDPGGWYAIRPPAGSFSWVSAEFIEPRQGNIGLVTGEHVVARVGSAFSDTRDVIQVRLDRGEEVEILEAHEFNSGPAAQTWYKISPPAGEFRWISGRYLDRERAETKPREPSPDHNLVIAKQNRHHTRDGVEHEVDRRRGGRDADEAQFEDDLGEDEVDEDIRLAIHEEEPPPPKARRAHRSPKRAPEPEEDDEEEEPAQIDEQPIRLKPEDRQPKADLKAEAEDLDLALSAMVAREPSEWRFAALRRQAETAMNRAQTALERGRIRRVLRKLDNFADIQQRYLAVMDARSGSGTNQAAATTARGRPGTDLSSLRYDGVGRLTQLESIDPRVPQFALVDAQGQVAAYVSPAPGVNLRRFLNQQVGINGTMGYLPERQAQLLTAKRIVPVDGQRLR